MAGAYSDPDFLATLAPLLLAQVETYFAPTDPAGPALPARRYVAGLEPAWDADQLVVWVSAVQPPRQIPSGAGVVSRMGIATTEGGPQQPFGQLLSITFNIDILRRYPQIGLSGSIVYDQAMPTPTELGTYGAEILLDLWALQHGLAQDEQANKLFGTPPPIACPNSVLLPVRALGPSADLAGWRFSFTISGA